MYDFNNSYSFDELVAFIVIILLRHNLEPNILAMPALRLPYNYLNGHNFKVTKFPRLRIAT